MNKRRRFVMLLVVMLAALVTSQCGAPATPQAEPTSAPEATAQPVATQAPAATEAQPTAAQPTEEPATQVEPKGSIQFLAYPWFALSDAELAKFTAETGYEVVQEVLDYGAANTKIATTSAAGTAPADVMAQYVAPLAANVRAGFVEPLDDCLPDDLKADLLGLSAFTHDGRVMGVPTYYDIQVLHVNTDMLQQAGIDGIPETIDQMVEDSHTIQAKGLSAYPLIEPRAANPGVTDRWELYSMVFGGSPLFDENYQPTFLAPDSAARQALKFMLETSSDIVDPKMVDVTEYQHDMFLAGDGAFSIAGVSQFARAQDASVSKVVDKVEVGLIPGVGSLRSATLDFYLDGLAVSSLSENKEAACEFVKWWLSPETSRAIYDELGATTARKSLLHDFVDEGVILGGDVLLEQAEYAKPIFASGIPPWFEEWVDDVAAQINAAARGNMTVDDAIQKIADKAVELQQ